MQIKTKVVPGACVRDGREPLHDARSLQDRRPQTNRSTAGPALPAGAAVPAGYVIGPEDVLSIVFWRDKEMSADVVVRPDGKISLPLLNDVMAAGYAPEELRAQLVKAASKFLEDPNATVVVKEIHSRKVFVTGQVGKSGTYPLIGEMNVLQMIAHVGGLRRIRRREEHRHPAERERTGAAFQVQLQGCREGQERAAEHHVEARRHDHRSVGTLTSHSYELPL